MPRESFATMCTFRDFLCMLTQIKHFQTITSVWTHIWLQNDAQSLKGHRRGILLCFYVICEIAKSHGPKYWRFGSSSNFSRWQLKFEFMDGYDMAHKASRSKEEAPYCFFKSSIKFLVMDLIWDYKVCRSYQMPQICLVIFSFKCFNMEYCLLD